MQRFGKRMREQVCYGMELVGIRPRRTYALDRMDARLLDYFDFRGGFFIEAGGNDGLTQSNTAYFERYLGWRGLLVEPVPQLARLCAANRPRSVVIQSALVPVDFSHPTIQMTYCNLMSIVKGARGSAEADQAFVAWGEQHLDRGARPYMLEVPALTLTNILRSQGVTKVDFLSLDVEGYEAPALRGLDFSQYAPTWILIEANDLSAVEAVLLPRYDFVAALSHHDRLYRLK